MDWCAPAGGLEERLRSPEETRNWGERFGASLKGGELILLCGELGSGKTVLVKGIAKGLGVTDPVTSPTFLLQKIYEGRLPLLHIDLYRLEAGEMWELEIDEWRARGAVVCVEWGNRLSNPAEPVFWIDLEILPECPEERRLRFRGSVQGGEREEETRT